jgi:hypothetical protein
MTKQIQMIELYCTVCRYYDSIIVAETQRLSNNFRPEFTDEECMAIYLFGISERKFEVKAIYDFIKDYWAAWFPKLPSYQKFNYRINRLATAFQILFAALLNDRFLDEETMNHLTDSMPVIVAGEKRSGIAKTAKGLCDKGYCSSKGIYYYGVKLHTLGQKQYKTLPKMCMVNITPASENDITVAKEWLGGIRNMDIYADKMYSDGQWFEELAKRNVHVYTPVKRKKGQELRDAADDLYSAAVSRIRQAIESFFNWIHQKTNIQNASKVRSVNGLISFIWARLAAILFFYS